MAAATLTCKQCGHVNEAERVYCHNCGAKLDRSLLPEEANPKSGQPKQDSRRVRKLVTPRRGFFVNGWRSFFNALFWALALSAVIQMVRPPLGIPPMVSKDELADTPPLGSILDEKAVAGGPQRIAIEEALINKYLLATVKSQGGGALSDILRFDRAFTNMSDGVCRITLQHSLFGYPLYVSSLYRVAIESNQLNATNVGGYIGRLPVHPLIMQYADFLFGKLWGALDRERHIMDKMHSVEVHNGQFVVVTTGAPRR